MSALSLFFETRKWYLRNEDTDETIESQFPTPNVTREVTNNYARHIALNRSKEIIQYLSSKNDTVSFEGMFFDEGTFFDLFTNSAEGKINKIISWAKKDDELGRPPIVTFWVGNGFLEQTSVIESVTGINYSEPTSLGALRKVTFTINLLQYEDFDLGGISILETRYHRARVRDYYELLTYREYGNALIGDVIRKRHPDQPNLESGDVVKLPSIGAIRTKKVQPTSIALSTAYGRKETPQRALRIATFDSRNRKYVSHVVVE